MTETNENQETKRSFNKEMLEAVIGLGVRLGELEDRLDALEDRLFERGYVSDTESLMMPDAPFGRGR